MFIYRANLNELKQNQIMLERKISWLCTRINATMKIELEKQTSRQCNLERHIVDKVLINKYQITYTFYKTLKKKYKKFLEDFKNNDNHKIYTFTLYRFYTK